MKCFLIPSKVFYGIHLCKIIGKSVFHLNGYAIYCNFYSNNNDKFLMKNCDIILNFAQKIDLYKVVLTFTHNLCFDQK